MASSAVGRGETQADYHALSPSENPQYEELYRA
jgi:hypothetical protein